MGRATRPSEDFSDEASSANNKGAHQRLMKDGEPSDHDFEVVHNTRNLYKDCSRWLRPIGLTFTICFFAVVLAASLQKIYWPYPSVPHHPHHDHYPATTESERMLGIQLHPENHVSRVATTVVQHWNITSDFRFPDGVKKLVYLVNGAFPGPTIECRSGDRLEIHVTNGLEAEGVSIHWHGLNMRGANDMDGAVGLTQCSIPVGETFVYEFEISEEQAGTFWWHAHSQVQRGDGMYGGLIVHRSKAVEDEMNSYGYEKEVLVMVGDWYHRSAEEVLSWYTSAKGFGNEPVPDSLLVNGVGRFICSMALPARPLECIDIAESEIAGLLGTDHDAGPIRLRFINVGSLAGFTVELSHGTLTPITVDSGSPIVGRPSTSVGIIYPGERVDVLLRGNVDVISHDSELTIYLDPENFKYSNSALRPNQSFPIFASQEVRMTNPDFQLYVHSDLTYAKSIPGSASIPAEAQQIILLYAKTQKLSIQDNHPTGYMNRTSWSPQASPAYPIIALVRSRWDANQLMRYIPMSATSNTWVDIIINNLDDGAHPFHLHGHSFYVIASHRSDHGWGSYSPYSSAASNARPNLNLVDPVLKDTVSVPRRGYVVIRFKADNVGIWLLHCHVLFHQASGMAMGLQVGGEENHSLVNEKSKALCRGI